MQYSEYIHKHNFCVWAAARATQRNFATVEILRKALEQSGIEEFVKLPCKAEEFDERHKKWCLSICSFLEGKGVSNASYGRAAKLVNVYLKGMLVLPDLSGEVARFIHPPIDRILLQNLSKKTDLDEGVKKFLKCTSWTKLTQEEYFDLVRILRNINGSKPFWKIEEYWTVTNES